MEELQTRGEKQSETMVESRDAIKQIQNKIWSGWGFTCCDAKWDLY